MASDPDVLARVARRETSDSFFGKGHPEIFVGMQALAKLGLAFSLATMRQVSGGAVDEVYLAKVLAAHGAPKNINHHLDALSWDRARVEAVRGPLTKLVKALQDPATNPDIVRATARALATAFDGHGSRRYLHDPNELVRTQMLEIEKRREGKARHPYGIVGLDDDEGGNPRLIPGAAPGQMTVVCGVPGSSKSTLTARIALGLFEEGKRIIYGAWEVGGGMTLELLAAMRLGYSRTSLLTGKLTREQLDALRVQMDVIAGYVRFFKLPGRDRGQKMTNDAILDVVHAYVEDSGADVAIFDLWKRCLRYTDPDDEEQALYRQQSNLAELGVHGILVQQLRGKDVEQRTNQRPTRESIKGSGAWFEVPDTILGLYRPGLSKRVDDNVAEVDVLKQRWGKFPLAVEFDWDGDKGSFENGRTVVYEPPTAAAGENDLVANFNFKPNKDEDQPRRASGGRK